MNKLETKLNLFCNMDAYSHVFILRVAEKLSLHVAEIIGKLNPT